jgi:hypothetical protein
VQTTSLADMPDENNHPGRPSPALLSVRTAPGALPILHYPSTTAGSHYAPAAAPGPQTSLTHQPTDVLPTLRSASSRSGSRPTGACEGRKAHPYLEIRGVEQGPSAQQAAVAQESHSFRSFHPVHLRPPQTRREDPSTGLEAEEADTRPLVPACAPHSASGGPQSSFCPQGDCHPRGQRHQDPRRIRPAVDSPGPRILHRTRLPA